jgi:hypothetical protein
MKKTVTYSPQIEAIHHEFDTAADVLLEEANSIIEGTNIAAVEKHAKLKRLGFGNSSEVARTEKAVEDHTKAKILAELVTSYKQHYPLNKFITDEQVKTICAKYGLVFGPTQNYIGFVPSKNLEEIADFKLKAEDIFYFKRIKEVVYYNSKDSETKGGKEVAAFLATNPIIIETSNLYYASSSSDYDGEMLIRHMCPNSPSINRVYTDSFSNREALSICAPEKDFNFENKVKNGFQVSELFKVTYSVAPDPGVLKKVRGGYLIVTVWGDEASDPILVNEINN